MGIHYRRQLVFYSDSNGSINRLQLILSETKPPIISDNVTIYLGQKPHALSVDWLNDFIYLAENKKVC